MSKMAQSGFVIGGIGLIAALTIYNTAQIANLEGHVVELRKGGFSSGGAGTHHTDIPQPDAGTARCEDDPQIEAAFADSNNLLQRSTRCRVTNQDAVPGQTLRMVRGSDPRGMNPYIANGADVTEYSYYMSDTLAEREVGNYDNYVPRLAVRVTSPDDGLTYNIQLREGVYWHLPDVDWSSGDYEWLKGDGPNGTHEFVADDIKFVFDMLDNPQVAGRISSLRNYFEALESVTVVDDHNLTIKFSEKLYTNLPMILDLFPSPRWLYRYDEDGTKFEESNWGQKLNEHWYNQTGIGVGPYKFVAWEPGVKLEFERNPNYWGEPPSFDRLLMPVVKDQEGWPRKLKTGEIDITQIQPEQYRTEVKGKSVGEFLGNPRIKYKEQPTLGYFYLGWNMDRPYFADKRVRQAMSLSLDRFGIVDNIFHGLGEVTSGPFPQQSPCNDDSIDPWPYDLNKAKAKLDEAGWTDTDGDGIRDKVVDGEKIDFRFSFLMYGSSSEFEALSSIWREDLLSIGVQMTPVAVEWSTMLKKMDEREFDVYSGAWVMGWDTDLMQLWHSKEADRTPSSNRIGFRNADADRIAETLRAEMDEQKRVELCHEFHALVHEEQPYTFIYQRKRPVLYWDHLATPQFSLIYPYRDPRYWSFVTAPQR